MVERSPEMQEILMRVGNVRKLVAALGITRQAIYNWPRVPDLRAHAVCAALGLPMEKVRPDLVKR